MQLYFTTCACGCNAFFLPVAHYWRRSPRRFINGHNGNRWSYPPLEQRFWKHVKRSEGCWEWSGPRDGYGYGRLNEGTQKGGLLAHRLSWELHFGPIPNGMYICHHCDNPPCVNPGHLFLGTQADNVKDSSRKGRKAQKLSENQIREIKADFLSGMTKTAIGRKFAVHPKNIDLILQGRIWAWVS